jgi:hypothetical protein
MPDPACCLLTARSIYRSAVGSEAEQADRGGEQAAGDKDAAHIAVVGTAQDRFPQAAPKRCYVW